MAARRNVLETMEDCELIKRYKLNREGIKLVVELVRDAITPRLTGITRLGNKMFGNTIFSNGENATLQCRRFRNIATISQLEELTELSSKLVKAEIIPDVFVNRKNVHSINTQIVFDATFNILDVVAKWPAGSTHDPHILLGSGLRQLFERHRVPVGCHLLGDSVYPCKTS
ncbi:putative nuclease HARBI1 [Merluccius polli]|uniref:Nuclease HARBI1 n=1 Tax=Merluccius polli TaxID=89951 RepID=A0AA47NRJ6_MERPO|nr:putative nuclease HARBI1 [Merluccius polli]